MIKMRNLSPELRAQIELASMGMALSPNGTVVYVDSGHANAGTGKPGTDPDNPHSTLASALDAVAASNGDVIVLMPGHAETSAVSAATAYDIDVAGVTVLGLGTGSLRPTFTVGTDVAATFKVTAANVTLANVLISNTIDNCTYVFQVDAAADFHGFNIEVRDTGAVEAARATRIHDSPRVIIDGFVHRGEGSGDQAVSAVSLDGSDDLVFQNFDIDAAGSAGTVQTTESDEPLRMRMRDGIIVQREAAVGVAVDLDVGTSGFFGPNVHIRLVDDNTNPYAAIDSGSDLNFLGPITVSNGDDEGGINIADALAIGADQSLVMTPWGAAREVTEAFQPAGSLVPIFTPTVGKSLIVGLYLQISTTIGAAADYIVQYSTTAAGANNLCAITQMDSEADETIFGLTGIASDVLSMGTARCAAPIVVDGADTGATIGVLGSEANVATGAGTWHCIYVPLERGALITAAA